MPIPIGSMYDIFTYIWLIFMVNVQNPSNNPNVSAQMIRLNPGDSPLPKNQRLDPPNFGLLKIATGLRGQDS